MNILADYSLDKFHKLGDSCLAPGEFCITEQFQREIADKLKSDFSYKNRYSNYAVYRYISDVAPESVILAADETRRDADRHFDEIRDLISSLEEGGAGFDQLRSEIDHFYLSLDRFTSLRDRIGDLANEHDEFLLMAQHLVDIESNMYRSLHKLSGGFQEFGQRFGRMRSALRMANSKRARIVPAIQQSSELLSFNGGVGSDDRDATESIERVSPAAQVLDFGAAISSEFFISINEFVGADELEGEAAFASLFLRYRPEIASFLKHPSSVDIHKSFVDRLWEMADVVFLEELFGDAPSRENGILQTLVSGPVSDARFKAVAEFVRSGAEPSQSSAVSCFETLGISAEYSDVSMLMRCLLITHPSVAMRDTAISCVPFHSLWQIIVYPRMPLAVLVVVSRRLRELDNEDIRKIFFDCVRGRLVTDVDASADTAELNEIRSIIMLFFTFAFLLRTRILKG